MLLKHGADPSIESDFEGTPLHHAARDGNIEIVKHLLAYGANVNAVGGWHNGVPLIRAALNGHTTVIQYLLDAGADVNATGGYYNDALQAAAADGTVESLRKLLDAGADLKAQGGRYGTALHAALTEGHMAIASILYMQGARLVPNNCSDLQYANSGDDVDFATLKKRLTEALNER